MLSYAFLQNNLLWNLDFWATISENGRRSSHPDNPIQIGKCDLISVWAIRDTERIFAPLNEVLLKILEKHFQLVVTCFRLTMEFGAFCFSRCFSNQKDYVLFYQPWIFPWNNLFIYGYYRITILQNVSQTFECLFGNCYVNLPAMFCFYYFGC